MKTMRYFLFLTLGLAVCLAFRAPDSGKYVFKHIQAPYESKIKTVKSIFEAPDGKIGVLTVSHLNFYCGGSIASFPIVYSYGHPLYIEEGFDHYPYYAALGRDGLIWIKRNSVLYVFDYFTQRFIPDPASLLRRMGAGDDVADIEIDSGGDLWVINRDGVPGLCTGNDIMRAEDPDLPNGERCLSLSTTGPYTWISYADGTIRRWDRNTGRFIQTISTHAGRQGVRVLALPDGDLWCRWVHGLAIYRSHEQRWEEVARFPRLAVPFMRTDGQGNLYVMTNSANVRIVNRRDLSVGMIQVEQLGVQNKTEVNDVIIDPRTGDMWLAVWYQGLFYGHAEINTSDFNVPTGGSLVKCVVDYHDDYLLLGAHGGMYRYDKATGRIDNPFPALKNVKFYNHYVDRDGRHWFATLHDGLICFDDISKGVYRQFRAEGRFCCITQDDAGRIWACHDNSIDMLDQRTGEFHPIAPRHPELAQFQRTFAIENDGRGRLVVGCSNGLFFYDPQNDVCHIPDPADPADDCFIHQNNSYNRIYRDSRGLLWFATYDGLVIADHENGRKYRLQDSDGLPSSIILHIVEDGSNNIWVSTLQGISRITVSVKENGYVLRTDNFGVTHANPKTYNVQSGTVTREGIVCFGHGDDVVFLDPRSIREESALPVPVINSMSLFNRPIESGETHGGRVILETAINYTPHIELTYRQNHIGFEFSALNFHNPSQTYFRYRLEGFDREWTIVKSSDNLGHVTYTNLRPGDYDLVLFSSDNNLSWSPARTLAITITPPFWRTPWAYALTTALALLALWLIIRSYEARRRRREEQRRQQFLQTQQEELNQMKFRFFTNISHELRTPLSLIIAPLDSLMESTRDSVLQRKLQSIHRNASELLALVNNLLDFRKLEMQGEKLDLSDNGINAFVSAVCTSFDDAAARRHIRFELQPLPAETFIRFDKRKMQNVLNNLLSNAFKFTPDYGSICVSLHRSGQTVEIEVRDTGCGIPDGDCALIFERYYQSASTMPDSHYGSGIGLHLAREYIKMHGGEIRVASRPGKGSVFTLILPADANHDPQPEKQTATEVSEEVPVADDSRKSLILIVEDHDEFRNYLVEHLSAGYEVISASNGAEAEKLSRQQSPELIVSDIMMPVMDGLELCRRIKSNIRTSHIPFILLTAKNSDSDRTAGYEAGADSFVSKPFTMKLIEMRIRKLIEQQRSRRERFIRSDVSPSEITITSLDEKLISRAVKFIEENMDNPEINVEDLSRHVGLTRVHLYRKLQSITGTTPSEFIHNIRLKRAASYLEQSQLTILDIASRVGYSNLKTFNRNFRNLFGVTPGQYAQDKRKK